MTTDDDADRPEVFTVDGREPEHASPQNDYQCNIYRCEICQDIRA